MTIELSHRRETAADPQAPGARPDGLVDIITTHVTVNGDLDEGQEARLRQIVSKCPVHKTLMARPVIEDEFEVVAR